jgi:hypothetical protein
MNRTRVLLLCAALAALPATDAFAVPKASGGQTCESTGTARKDGKDDQGHKVNCLWDTCTYTECSTSGGQISNCVRKTEYSNPSDCHAALSTGVKNKLPMLKNGGTMKKLQ